MEPSASGTVAAVQRAHRQLGRTAGAHAGLGGQVELDVVFAAVEGNTLGRGIRCEDAADEPVSPQTAEP
jgi:hypothetical protein